MNNNRNTLSQLYDLFEKGVLTQEEYDKKKEQVLLTDPATLKDNILINKGNKTQVARCKRLSEKNNRNILIIVSLLLVIFLISGGIYAIWFFSEEQVLKRQIEEAQLYDQRLTDSYEYLQNQIEMFY